jgi:hypothetical protein
MARAVGDITAKWVAAQQFTLTLASLATDANLLVGRESTVIDLSTLDNVEDAYLSGKITTGTTPTAGVIEVWAFIPIDDTPNYGGGIAGTGDAGATLAALTVKFTYLKQVATLVNSTSSNVVMPFVGINSLKQMFGCVPKKIGIFVTHSTVAALNSTGGNHELTITPLFSNAKLS